MLIVGSAVVATGFVMATFFGFIVWSLWRDYERSSEKCGNGIELVDPPPPARYGTMEEICTHGDDPNPGAFYSRTFPSDPEIQERAIGGRPARFSGYTAWIDSVSLVDADRYVDGYDGAYVRIEVRVFNRESDAQGVSPTAFNLWREDEGFRAADFVGASDELGVAYELPSGSTMNSAVYLYVGEPRGDVFVRFDPDGNSTVAVWQVLDDGRPVIPGAVPAS